MEAIIIAIITGVGAYIGIVALIPRQMLAEQSKHARSQMQQIERAPRPSPAAARADSGSLLREQIQTANAPMRALLILPGMRAAYPFLLKAGLTREIGKFTLLCLLVWLLLIFALKGLKLLSAPLALALVAFGAWRYVKRRIRKRNDAFLNLFPDALDMIVRSVRSGYPLNAALRMVAENMQPPVKDEFRQVADEVSYGSPLMEALNRLSLRIDEPDIRFFVVVLSVQQEVGGNLAEVLSNLAGIIRKRKHLRMKVRALTSEGRATAWVLGLLPVFEFGAIHLVAPTHLTPLFTTPLGNMILAGAIGIVLLGVFIVKHLVNFKV